MQAKSTCYYNDTFAGTVNAIPCDPTTGLPDTKADWRTVLKLDPDSSGAPDGMAIDKDGNLWIAHEKGSQVCFVPSQQPVAWQFLQMSRR